MKRILGLAAVASATHPLNRPQSQPQPPAGLAGLADIQNLIADFEDLEPKLDLTKFTKKEFLVERNENQVLPVILAENNFSPDLLQNHGHWCFGLYGASGKIMKGEAVDPLDTACKTWRQQTRCLMERNICHDLIDDYRLKIFDNENFQCERLSGECGYEKCIIDLNAALKIMEILDSMSDVQISMIGQEAKENHSEVLRNIEVQIKEKDEQAKVFLKSGVQTPKPVDDIFTKAKHQCCRMDDGVYTSFDSTTQMCVDHPYPQAGEKMRICKKKDILPSYARQPWSFNNQEENHGAHLAIDGQINDHANTGKIQRTKIALNNWLYVDYGESHGFDIVEIFTPINCCAKAASNLKVRLVPSDHECTYIPTGETSTPDDMENRIKPGEILKFDCGGKWGQIVKIEKESRGVITVEEIKAFKKDCY